MPKIAKQKRWYAFLRATGICRRCPAKVAPNRTRCRSCLDKAARGARAKSTALIRVGLCGRGCGRPRDGEHTCCAPCMERAREYYRAHWREFPSCQKKRRTPETA